MIQVSIPIYKELPPELLRPLMNIVQTYSIKEVSIRTYTKDGLISRARNRMMSDFILNKEAEHLITFDSDCIFTLRDFQLLISHKDRDIVGGAVPTKCDTPYYVYRLKKPLVQEGPLLELDTCGDFTIFNKSSILKMIDRFPELEYIENKTKEKRWALFQPMIKDKEYLDETWSFSVRAREAGLRIWLDTRIQLGHLGTKIFYKK